MEDPVTDRPAPHRVGEPSPLIFHLSAALAAYSQALLAAPRADHPHFPWAPELAKPAQELGPDLDRMEIAAEICRRMKATLTGLEIWQRHPYRRRLAEPPVIWRAGAARLLDYGRVPEAADPEGMPILVVPSLINRAYILDLAPGRSLLRWMAAAGFRPLLLDWGSPGPEETGFALEDYGRLRLLPALDHVRRVTGQPPRVLGYCMGGTLSVGLAARLGPEAVSGLVTIGAPWDFASDAGLAGGLRTMVRGSGDGGAEALLRGLGETFGLIPVPVFQTLFALINPIQTALKFQRLARLDPDGPSARLFVALEDWLADGVAMAPATARDLLIGWHVHNETALGSWSFLGGTVDPRAIGVPVLNFCGRTDSIAPPPLAEALGTAVPHARLIRPATGHVGMVVGGLARSAVWRPMAEFLRGGYG